MGESSVSASDTIGERVFAQPITSLAELRALVGEPSEQAVRKDIGRLDEHCRRFISLAPFLLLGTSGAAGRCDVSPKGDAPGFVLVLDERTLAIPDRPGNRRLDSLQNIFENPHVGLLFLVPGLDETLRVNGSARVVRDPDLLRRLAVGDRAPTVAIVVQVEECYLHCAKAFLRSDLWNPAKQLAREQFPSLGRVLRDQLRPASVSDAEHECAVAEAEAQIADAYQNRLY